MGKLSTSEANAILDARFTGGEYVGLSSTQPTDTGTNITEPTDGGYARAQITAWDAATARAKTTNGAAAFPAPTSTWGGVALGWFVIMSAAAGGTMRAWGALTSPITVTSGGSTPTIPDAGLTVSLPGT